MSVFVVEDDKAVRRIVATGYGNRGMVEITSGLGDGEQIVTVGQTSLKQESRVTVINAVDKGELKAEAEQEGSENAASD